MIRDRIWESNKLRRCSREAALAYPWIFLVADPWGRFEYNPRRIWTRVFGGREDVSLAEVDAWLTEYEQCGLLFRYHLDGELAVWVGFRDRPRGKRLPSQYPDPEPFMRKAAKSGSTSVKKVRPRKSGSTFPPMERELDRDMELERELEVAPAAADASTALVPVPSLVAPLPWNNEAAELWFQEYRGDMPGQAFAQLKPIVTREGWERVRPALIAYMAETPVEFVNLPKSFVGAFGRWEALSRGKPPRSPPSAKAAAKDQGDMAMIRAGMKGGNLDRGRMGARDGGTLDLAGAGREPGEESDQGSDLPARVGRPHG